MQMVEVDQQSLSLGLKITQLHNSYDCYIWDSKSQPGQYHRTENSHFDNSGAVMQGGWYSKLREQGQWRGMQPQDLCLKTAAHAVILQGCTTAMTGFINTHRKELDSELLKCLTKHWK